MPQSRARRAAAPTTVTDVTCPFCALHCDDLAVDVHSWTVTRGRCATAARGYALAGRTAPEHPALVRGKPVPLDAAIAALAKRLKAANTPLISGLATDVAGVRAALAVAEQTGAVTDHLHGDGLGHNLATLQTAGWITTTLSEIRNRADVVLTIGVDTAAYPRFVERTLGAQVTLSGLKRSERALVRLGGPRTTRDVVRGRHLACEDAALGEVVAAMRTLLAGRPLRAKRIAGLAITTLSTLVEQLRRARYAVIVWAPGRLHLAHADLIVHQVCELVRDLNVTTRCAGFTLGGDEGGSTAAAVTSWQSGFPYRVSYAAGYPHHDPYGYATRRLLARNRVDALVWIAAFPFAPGPPNCAVPTAVLAHPRVPLQRTPEVFIPVGLPGVDHTGQLFRCDAVAALPLPALRPSGLPSVAAILNALSAVLE